jgi:hypothetical protein
MSEAVVAQKAPYAHDLESGKTYYPKFGSWL